MLVPKYISQITLHCKSLCIILNFDLHDLGLLIFIKQRGQTGFDKLDNVSLSSLLKIQKANVLAYIAGYTCLRIEPKLCSNCAQSLGSVQKKAIAVNHPW